MNRDLMRLLVLSGLVLLLQGCTYMATSVAIQGALAGGGQPPPDPRKRITESQILEVTGKGWRRSIEIDAVTFHNEDHGLYLKAFARNGGAGGSEPQKFLIDVYLSNDDEHTYQAMFSLFSKQHWVKEPILFHPEDVQYISADGRAYQPIAVSSCYRDAGPPHSAISDTIEIKPGSGKCVSLVFPVDSPSGTMRYQVQFSKIRLGGLTIEQTIVTLGPRDG